MQNIGVSGGATIISKGLRTISAIALARLLNPIDFSIIGISQVLLGFVNQFSDIGYYAAVIQKKDRIETAQYTGFYLRIFQALGVTLLLFLLAPFWAKFYETQAITNVIRISLISILVAPFSFIPATHFLRNLQFKKSALVGISQNITYVIIAVALAFLGFSYWSIVWGTIAGSVVSVIVTCIILPWKPKLTFNPHVAKELFNFGKFILLSGLVLFAISNIDNMLIGKIAGLTLLGHYVIAYKWGLWVKNNLANVVGSVMFPTFSRIQDDLERVKRGYLQALKYLSMIIFPASFGLMVIAPEFVRVILSPKWIPAIVPMQILCIAGLCQTLSTLDGNLIIGLGKPHISVRVNLVFLIILAVLLYPMICLFGIVGASIAVMISAVVVKVIHSLIIKRLINIGIKAILTSMFKFLIISIIIVSCVMYLRYQLYNFYIPEWVILIILFFFSVFFYLLILILIAKKDLINLWQMLIKRSKNE